MRIPKHSREVLLKRQIVFRKTQTVMTCGAEYQGRGGCVEESLQNQTSGEPLNLVLDSKLHVDRVKILEKRNGSCNLNNSQRSHRTEMFKC